MTYQVALTQKSRNAKTGPIPVSTTSADTCPVSCPLKDGGCYAKGGPLGMYWAKVTAGQHTMDWAAFTGQVAALPAGQLWRHNQAGDLPGDGVAIDAAALAELTSANAGRRGFTYTHYPVTGANRAAIAAANAAGFTINLSANDLAEADTLAETGAGPVVVVLPADVEGRQPIATPAGRKVVVCPATYRDDVSCASCGLCAHQRAANRRLPGAWRVQAQGRRHR